MRTPQTIIRRPLLTEKSNRLKDTGGAEAAPAETDALSRKILFEVARDANKIEIREAIEKLFSVTVLSVRTQIVRGKKKRIGRFEGRRPHWKKAIVTLKAGDAIEFFEGV
jgi:large subunit ribosomal protein L23